jgi:lycopene cyclase domain-containing protein
MTYLVVLAFIVAGSAWLEWGLRTRVLVRWRRLLLAGALGTVPFLLWDLHAVDVGHWWFDPGQLLGVTLPGDIPLEELLFFPAVAFAGILTLEAVRSVRRRPMGDEEPSGAADPETAPQRRDGGR